MKMTLDEEAANLHEIFLSYLRAGFTEEQAMDMIKFRIAVALGVGDGNARTEE